MNAQQLLKLVEGIDHTNNKAMNRLDFEVTLFMARVFDALGRHNDGYPIPNSLRKFSRSRDALMLLRMEDGGALGVSALRDVKGVVASYSLPTKNFQTPRLPTEALAELHVLLQVGDYHLSTKAGDAR